MCIASDRPFPEKRSGDPSQEMRLVRPEQHDRLDRFNRNGTPNRRPSEPTKNGSTHPASPDYNLRFPSVASNGIAASAHPFPVIFAFRENGVYEKCLPLVEARLVAQGFTVKILSAPRNAKSQDIDVIMDNRQGKMRSGLLFADGTVRKSWTPINCSFLSPKSPLDDMFTAAAQSAISRLCNLDQVRNLPSDMRSKKEAGEYLSRCGPPFIALFEAVFKDWVPDQIVIFEKNLKDHPPFAISHLAKLSSPTAFLTRWLTQAGYPKVSISVVRSPRELVEELLEPKREVLFLGDRHYLTPEVVKADLDEILEELDQTDDAEFSLDESDSDVFSPTEDERREFLLEEYRALSEALGINRRSSAACGRKPWVQFPIENLIPTLVDTGTLSPSRVGSQEVVVDELCELLGDHIFTLERQLKESATNKG